MRRVWKYWNFLEEKNGRQVEEKEKRKGKRKLHAIRTLGIEPSPPAANFGTSVRGVHCEPRPTYSFVLVVGWVGDTIQHEHEFSAGPNELERSS
jgi:hypothetical protein